MNKAAAISLFVLFLFSCKEETKTPVDPGWSQVFHFGPNRDTYALATYGATVYISTSDGLYRSDDNGENWQEITNPNAQLEEGPGALTASTGKVFASGPNGLFSSEDFGVVWQKVSSFAPLTGIITSMASDGTFLLAGTHDGQLFRSANLGQSWTRVLESGPSGGTIVKNIVISGNNVLVFIDGAGLLLSTNRGDTWSNITGGLVLSTHGAIAISGSTLFTSAGGVYWSQNNGQTWKLSEVFLDENGAFIADNVGASVSSIVQNQEIVYVVSGPDLFYSSDAGLTFHKMPSKEEVVNGAFRLYTNTFFVFGLDQHRLCRSSFANP